MKNKRQLSGSYFGPRSHLSPRQKVANGLSLRKPRKHTSRFGSKRMNDINEEVERRQASMQSITGNRKDNGVSNAYASHMHSSKTLNPSKKFDKSICKSNYNVKDRRRDTISQVRQTPPSVSNNGQLNALAPLARSVSISNHPSARNVSKRDHPLAPKSKHMDQPCTSMPDDALLFSTKDMKHSKSCRFRNALSSEQLEKHNPVRSKDHLNATSELLELSQRLKVKQVLVLDSNTIGSSGSQPNHLKAMAQLVHKQKNIDMYLGSRSKRRTEYYQQDIVAGKCCTKNLESLKSNRVFTISKGPNILMEDGILVSNKVDPTENKKRQGDRSGFHVCCDDHEQEDTKANGSPNSSLSLNINQVKQVLQSNLGNPSSLFGGNLSTHQRAQPNGCDRRTNDGKSKRRRKEPLPEENPETRDDIDREEAIQLVNRNRRSVKKWGRCIETNDYEDADSGGQNPIVVEADVTGLKGCHATVSKCVEGQCCCCSKPIDEPIWSGIFKIGSKEYISLAGHMSTKSGEKVWKLSRSLLPVVELTKLPRLEVWPKKWEASIPTDDNIGLYFFSHKMRPDENLDQLVKEVMENDLVLRAVIGEAEMLIFPSILLPKRYHKFQTKHYLWGVFKPREEKVAAKVRHELKAPEEVRQGDAMRHAEPATEDTTAASNATTTVPAETNGFATDAASVPTEPAKIAADARTVPANHAQSDSRTGAPPGRMIGFVVRQTPRLEQLIQEIEREGALVVAMRGEMIGAVSWPGNITAAMQ